MSRIFPVQVQPIKVMGAQEADGGPDEGGTTLWLGDHSNEPAVTEKSPVESVVIVQQQRKVLLGTYGLRPFTVPPTDSRVFRSGLLEGERPLIILMFL